MGPLPGNQGEELGCVTVYVQTRGQWAPKQPTAGNAPGGGRRYVQLGRNEKVLAHRLGWVFDNPSGDFGLLASTDVEASHLCGHSLCCNGNHIAMEPRAYNQSRSFCLCTWEIRDPLGSDAPRTISVCTHYPLCLRRADVYQEVIAPWTDRVSSAAEPSLPPMPQGTEPVMGQTLLSSHLWASWTPESEWALVVEVPGDEDA